MGDAAGGRLYLRWFLVFSLEVCGGMGYITRSRGGEG